MITLHGPLRMISDPLGDVGLRREHTLLQRSLPSELQALLFAPVQVRDLADHHDYLNEAHGSVCRSRHDPVQNARAAGFATSYSTQVHVLHLLTLRVPICPALRPTVRDDASMPGARCPDQALSAPDALATWVAMKSIRPGERQS